MKAQSFQASRDLGGVQFREMVPQIFIAQTGIPLV
jgi:hypothetical protein